MKKLNTIIIIFSISLIFATGLSFADVESLQAEGEEIEYIASELVKQVISKISFEKAEVIFRRGDEVYLNIGRQEGFVPKEELALFRYTEDLKHPITRELLGKVEEKIGQIEIVYLKDKSSIARIISEEKGKKIDIGDWVKDVKSKPVVFMGLSPVNPERDDVFSREVASLFLSKFKYESNFSLPEAEELEELKNKLGLIKYNGFISPDIAKDIAKELSVEFVITARLMDLGTNIYFNFQIFGRSGEILAIIEKEISKDNRISSLLQTKVEETRDSLPENFLTLEREIHFPYEILDFTVDDIDGDGISDFIVLTPKRVRIFHLNVVFEENISFPYEVNPNFRIRSREKVGNIFITDFNRNGKKELTLSSAQGLGGEIFEWNDDNFHRLIELKERVIAGIGSKPFTSFLVSDFLGGRNYFAGEVAKHLFLDSLGQLQKVELHLPVDFYSIAVIASEKSTEKKWVILDNNGALTVLGMDNKKIWQSGEMFGVHIEMADLDGNGKPEIVLTSNEILDEGSKDHIYVLEWNKIGPVLRWKSPEIQGSILKFHFGDIDGDNRSEFIAINEKKGKTFIQIYKISR